jgi:hypothetical protein
LPPEQLELRLDMVALHCCSELDTRRSAEPARLRFLSIEDKCWYLGLKDDDVVVVVVVVVVWSEQAL